MEEETLWNEFIYARVQCNLEVVCPEDEKSVKASMQNLRKYVSTVVALSQKYFKLNDKIAGIIIVQKFGNDARGIYLYKSHCLNLIESFVYCYFSTLINIVTL